MKVDEMVKAEVNRVANDVKQPKLKEIGGLVTNPEKSPMRKFLGIFLTDDLPGVRKHLMTDYVYPAAKDFVAGILFETIQRMFYGNGRPTNTNYNNVSNSLVRANTVKTNYANPTTVVSTTTTEQNTKVTWDNVIMESRQKAREVIAELQGSIRQYGKVSVMQLYDCLKVPDSIDISDQYMGWTNLDNVPILPVPGGFKVCLPKPTDLR
jgi:hypothetical protein